MTPHSHAAPLIQQLLDACLKVMSAEISTFAEHLNLDRMAVSAWKYSAARMPDMQWQVMSSRLLVV
jgi:hypothetical protein